MQVNVGHDIDGISHRVGGSMNEKFMSFDIEIKSMAEPDSSSNAFDDSNTVKNYELSEAKSQNSHLVTNVLKTLFFILIWYIVSTFLTLYNKTLLGDTMGKFPAPLLMNTVHFTMQAVISNTVTWCCPHKLKPSVAMSWHDYFVKVVPTALGTALDVNLSNASLVFISVTFATMCKSAAPIFLLIFAFSFRLETPSFKLLGIILVISIGILLTVSKETDFELSGFIIVMLAAVMSGFRWTMTQILLQKESYGLKNPLTFMSYVTPIMAVITAIFSLILDPWDEFKSNSYFNSSYHTALSCMLMAFGGTLAFLMVLTEFILVSMTSAVTVTIAGVVKEAVTILVAVLYLHDQFTWLKGLGLFVIMIGVSLFNWYKYNKLHKGNGFQEDPSAAKYVILEEEDDLPDEN
ncbi:hypothetical protein QQ045_017969 [Rhodiola kirilowii]